MEIPFLLNEFFQYPVLWNILHVVELIIYILFSPILLLWPSSAVLDCKYIESVKLRGYQVS